MKSNNLTPRIITHFGVTLQPQGRRAIPAVSPVNLSETGTCVRLSIPLEQDQPVHLAIELDPDTPPLTTDGRVIWTRHDQINRKYYCGIGFADLTEEDAHKIRTYTEKGAQHLLRFFSEFPLFEDFSAQDCRQLLQITTLRSLEKQEILYQHGSQDVDLQGLFIVQNGLVSIFRGSRPVKERLLAVVSAGELFGETTLITEKPHSATVMAVNPSTLIQINKIGFHLIREQEPKLALKIMEVIAHTLSQRLGRTTSKLFSPLKVK